MQLGYLTFLFILCNTWFVCVGKRHQGAPKIGVAQTIQASTASAKSEDVFNLDCLYSLQVRNKTVFEDEKCNQARCWDTRCLTQPIYALRPQLCECRTLKFHLDDACHFKLCEVMCWSEEFIFDEKTDLISSWLMCVTKKCWMCFIQA